MGRDHNKPLIRLLGKLKLIKRTEEGSNDDTPYIYYGVSFCCALFLARLTLQKFTYNLEETRFISINTVLYLILFFIIYYMTLHGFEKINKWRKR